ncbi:hypothetical protein ABEB36_000324 [Hypothenemus hampei]|uniref:Envelope protein n=1 Tax=Hypothenemus hampei TaxID=57062 RepID=A0ABD1FAV3_HYPHA
MDIPTDIIGVDYNSQQYFTLTAEELENSNKIQNHLYICSPLQIKNMETNPHCGLNEIYQKVDSTICPVSRRKFNTVIWQQLYTTNTWLFISPNKSRIAITYNGIREEATINRTGIITTSSNCIISTKPITLAPRYTETIPVMAGYIRPVVANLTLSKINFNTVIKPIEEVRKPPDNLEGLKQNQEALQEELEHTHWYQVKHHSVIFSSATTISILIGITIIIGVTRGIRWCKNRRPTSSRTAGKQENHEPEEFELRPLRRVEEKNEVQPIYSLPQQDRP